VLREAYPTHGFLAEESGNDNGCRVRLGDRSARRHHQLPARLPAVLRLDRPAAQGRAHQAVVFDPNRNELFTATKGVGAYLNDRRIRVSKVDKIEDALMGTGFPFKEVSNLDEYLRMFSNVTLGCAGRAPSGAAALDLAWVAAGRIDGFWEIGLAPWDMAAGALLVREAGGLIGDFKGEDKFLDSGRVVASNGKIFGAFLQLLAQKG
jgi:myo-inositol-1(or 4)-monophosphatase